MSIEKACYSVNTQFNNLYVDEASTVELTSIIPVIKHM